MTKEFAGLEFLTAAAMTGALGNGSGAATFRLGREPVVLSEVAPRKEN